MRFLLLLVAFAVNADTSLQLDGDLDLVGDPSGSTVGTTIDYIQEGNNVQLCIGLTLQPGGTGGAEVQTIDEASVNNPANFAFPENNVIERTIISSSDGAYGLAKVNNAGYYYFEAEILEGSNFNTSFGISWNTSSNLSVVFSHSIRFSDGMNRVNGVNAGAIAGWQAMGVGDSIRYWYKDGKIFAGQIINGVASVIGDPVAETGNVYTVNPNADIKGAMIFGAVAKYKYRALTANISEDSLGATPLED